MVVGVIGVVGVGVVRVVVVVGMGVVAAAAAAVVVVVETVAAVAECGAAAIVASAHGATTTLRRAGIARRRAMPEGVASGWSVGRGCVQVASSCLRARARAYACQIPHAQTLRQANTMCVLNFIMLHAVRVLDPLAAAILCITLANTRLS